MLMTLAIHGQERQGDMIKLRKKFLEPHLIIIIIIIIIISKKLVNSTEAKTFLSLLLGLCFNFNP